MFRWTQYIKTQKGEKMEITITVPDGVTAKEMALAILQTAVKLDAGLLITSCDSDFTLTEKNESETFGEEIEADDFTAVVDTKTITEGFEDEPEPPPKKAAKTKGNGKAKKVTIDTINDICKAHAMANGRPATLKILEKKFKVQSVTALKPEQYDAVLAAMAVD